MIDGTAGAPVGSADWCLWATVRITALETVLARCVGAASKHRDSTGLRLAMHPAFEDAQSLLSAPAIDGGSED